MIENSIANPNLSWERNYAANIGLDFGLFKRVNVTVDAYRRHTTGLLMSMRVNNISGFGSITGNIGEMENKGFEVEINSRNIDNRNFFWTTALNFAHNKNKILKLNEVDEYDDGRYIRRVGESYGSIYLREYAGADAQTGLPMYYENLKQADGTFSRNLVSNPNNAYRVIVCDIFPYLTGSLQNTLGYKNAIVNRANPDKMVADSEFTLDRVLTERRKELVGEGHRFFDALRNGKTIKREGGVHLIGVPSDIDWNYEKCVLPIPVDQFQLNPDMQQNPGYARD